MIEKNESAMTDTSEVQGQALAPPTGSVERLRAEIERMRETNRRLHVRCQAAESAARENVEACLRKGVSFGRALSYFAYLDCQRAKDEAIARLRDMAEVDPMADVDAWRRARTATFAFLAQVEPNA